MREVMSPCTQVFGATLAPPSKLRNIIWLKIFIKLLFMILPIIPCQFGARKHDNSFIHVPKTYS